jgi:hypothetical protein
MNPKAPVEKIAGFDSWKLETSDVAAYITRSAGMLAPVYFDRTAGDPIQPYSISPWCGVETQPGDTPTILRVLRGDFFCVAFGGNSEPVDGKRLPPHGETANNDWSPLDYAKNERGVRFDMGMELPLMGGRVEARTVLLEGHNVVYQRHDLSGFDGPINPGHHATLRFPDREGAGRLAFSPHRHARTYVQAVEQPENKGYSTLKPDQPIPDLTSVSRVDGRVTDLTRYPARRGFEDIAIVCADQSLRLAWSSVTLAEEGWVWFSLRDPRLFPSTLLWMSNGGRHYSPWNGRHVNVLGVEDMTGFFHEGLAPSSRENKLSQLGIPTCARLKPDQTLRLPYIQGVVRVPKGFDRVRGIEAVDENTIVLKSESGLSQSAACRADFALSGSLPGLLD